MSFFGIPIRNGLSLGLGTVASLTNGPGFLPSELYYDGIVQGAWYDPSDVAIGWRYNLLTYTEQFDNAAWGKQEATVTANAAVAPDGTTTADKLIPSVVNDGHWLNQNVLLTAATHTFSFYAKADGYNFVQILNAVSGSDFANFNLSTGVVGSSSGYTPTIEALPNGWYRCSASFTGSATNTGWARIGVVTAANSARGAAFAGDGTSGVFIWGAQLQTGSTATTYQQIVTPEISYLNYDPNPVLFQDSAGTTPVTAVEQPVGLMLDKSKGLVLGPELVTNGDFSEGSQNWGVVNADATHIVTFAGGTVRYQSDTTTPVLALEYLPTPLVIGKFYLATVVVSSRVSGSLKIDSANNAPFSFGGTVGVFTGVFVAAAQRFSIVRNSANVDVTIDSISVRELPGNHAYQTTSASRPTLRARYNLLTRSEEFNDAAWVKVAGSVSVSQNAVGPTGVSNSATTVTALAGTNNHWLYQSFASSAVAYSQSVYAKAGTANWIGVSFGAGATTDGVFFNLSNGTVGTAAFGSTGTIQNVGDGWYRCTVTRTGPGGTYFSALEIHTANSQALNWNAAGTETILIWGAQAIPTAVFPSNTYQRVGAATDYATGAAFPPYLFFDGTDDSMLTNSVDFATVTSDGQARRNLLSNPTQFDASTWTLVNCTISANATTAPDGTTTADKIVSAALTGAMRPQQTVTLTAATTYTVSAYFKASEVSWVSLRIAEDGAPSVWFDVANGVLGTRDSGWSASSITNVGSGWYRCQATLTTVGTSYSFRFLLADNNGTTIYTGNGVNGVFIWGAQLETGSTATAFQNIGTDKMLVVAGVTKNNDSAACIAETSSDTFSNAGSFIIQSSQGGNANYTFYGRGSTFAGRTATTYTAPNTAVLATAYDIAQSSEAAEISVKINGVTPTLSSAAGSTGSMGTGNFGNYPLYIGRRNNASLPFNGNIYSMIIAGQSYSSGQISSTESWVAAKTPLGTI